MAARFARTEAGRTEIQRKALPLSRPARNLLLIVDAGRSAADWLALVHGATPADLQALLQAGLLADQASAAGATAAGSAPPPGPRMSLAQALATKSQQSLSLRITAEARPRLGMIKGYKLMLDMERCQSPAQARALAQRFVEQVRASQGDAAAVALAQVLLAPG